MADDEQTASEQNTHESIVSDSSITINISNIENVQIKPLLQLSESVDNNEAVKCELKLELEEPPKEELEGFSGAVPMILFTIGLFAVNFYIGQSPSLVIGVVLGAFVASPLATIFRMDVLANEMREYFFKRS